MQTGSESKKNLYSAPGSALIALSQRLPSLWHLVSSGPQVKPGRPVSTVGLSGGPRLSAPVEDGFSGGPDMHEKILWFSRTSRQGSLERLPLELLSRWG